MVGLNSPLNRVIKMFLLQLLFKTNALTFWCDSRFLSERRKKASGWEKNLLYPMVMLILLTGTVSVWDSPIIMLMFVYGIHSPAGGRWDSDAVPQNPIFFALSQSSLGVETTFV